MDAREAVAQAIIQQKQKRPSALSRINAQPVKQQKKEPVAPPPQGGVRG